MANQERQGVRDVYANMSPENQLDFLIEQKIRELVNTSALVSVCGCTSSGSGAPAGTVSAKPMVAQTDASGNALPMATIPSMPHARVQGGIAAIVIDPVPGDLGVACFCKADSSTVKTGMTEPQRPGSHRAFDQADGMLVATVSNKAPEVWIELKQDKTIVIHAPEGVTIETDKTVEIKAGEGIKLDTPMVTVTGSMTCTGQNGGGAVSMKGSLTVETDGTKGGTPLEVKGHVAVDGNINATGSIHGS